MMGTLGGGAAKFMSHGGVAGSLIQGIAKKKRGVPMPLAGSVLTGSAGPKVPAAAGLGGSIFGVK